MESKIVMNDDVEQCNQQTKEIESSEKEIRKIVVDLINYQNTDLLACL